MVPRERTLVAALAGLSFAAGVMVGSTLLSRKDASEVAAGSQGRGTEQSQEDQRLEEIVETLLSRLDQIAIESSSAQSTPASQLHEPQTPTAIPERGPDISRSTRHQLGAGTLSPGCEFANLDEVVSVEIDPLNAPGTPMRLENGEQIRSVLGPFQAGTDVRLRPRIGYGHAKITVNFAAGGEAVYVVSSRAWEGGPESLGGRLTTSWEEILASLENPR